MGQHTGRGAVPHGRSTVTSSVAAKSLNTRINPQFAQSSGEPKGPLQELRGLHVLSAVLVLGFAGAGGVVLLGGGLQELAGDGRVLDGGGVAGPEHGGEVQGVGAAGEDFLELPVDA
jgi:hypothetical protein